LYWFQHLTIGFGVCNIMVKEATSLISSVKLPTYAGCATKVMATPRHPFLKGPNSWFAICT
jgi:hypothetical protein